MGFECQSAIASKLAPTVECVALTNCAGFIQFGLESMAVRVGKEYFDKIHMWREISQL
jgi:hypothetical protein